MDPAKPSLQLLRSLTDQHVLGALMRQRRLTRAELAAETGISKPTVGESVRRLTEAGLVVDTGQRTAGGRGRGRVGSYYALAGDLGLALAVSIAPEGIVAECVSAHGDTVSRATEDITRPARPEHVVPALRAAVAGAVSRTPDPAARLAVVSAADPVDRATGRLIQLPDAPFLLGELDPVEVLAPLVDGPVTVDNDVNWAARAEASRSGATLADFAYLFLGEGLGCAVVSDGQVSRGHAGLAGEVSHLITTGPRGQARPFIEVFGELGLRQPRSTAIDVTRLLAAASGPQAQPTATRRALARAVSGVLAAIVALADPELIILGGSWGGHPVILDALSDEIAQLPRRIEVRAARHTAEPALTGARNDALARLRAAILTASDPGQLSAGRPTVGP
ncbi:MAG: ROK family transcriptional regulator [Streptosporangiaceae bacterium]